MKRLQSLFTFPVLSIYALAVVVRVLYNKTAAGPYTPLHDSLTYQSIAYNILHNHCYCLLDNSHLPTVDRAPLWPAMIAFFYAVSGPHNDHVRLFLSLLGAGTCVLIYFFARDLFGKLSALIVGLLAAIYPFLFVYDGWLYSESLYIFLLLAFCYALYHQQRTPRTSLMLLSGLLLGLLSLTRPNGLLILGLFLAWIVVIGWSRLLDWRIVLKSALVISLLSIALVIPWTIRNFLVTGTLVPVAVGDGKVMLGAYNNQTADPAYQNGYYSGIWIIPNESTPWIARQFPPDCAGACEVTRDTTYKNDAIQWIKEHLGSMPHMLGLHIINLWQTVPQEADLAINRFPDLPASQFVVSMMEIITPIVFALAALGLIVTWRRWRELLFIYFMLALTIVQCIVLYAIPRFRAPIEPMLLILGAGFISWCIGLWEKRHRPALERSKEAPKEAIPTANISRQ